MEHKLLGRALVRKDTDTAAEKSVVKAVADSAWALCTQSRVAVEGYGNEFGAAQSWRDASAVKNHLRTDTTRWWAIDGEEPMHCGDGGEVYAD